MYSKCDWKTQRGLDGSRANEWKKWESFDAVIHLPDEILRELIGEGHSVIPTQWIETDKNEHLKRPGLEHLHEPRLKSRLVNMGNLEDSEGIRADSLTCATDGVQFDRQLCGMSKVFD